MSQPHVSARVRRGWALKIDVSVPFRDEELKLDSRTVAIVEIIKASGWDKLKRRIGATDSDAWENLLDELVECGKDEDEDEATWNEVWDEIYDHADRDRVWLSVWPTLAPAKEKESSTTKQKPSSDASSDTSKSRHPSAADPSSSGPSSGWRLRPR